MAGVKLDQGPRAELYGRKLSRMIQLETVSCRDQQDRTKFLEFHKLLAELFPLVHQVCEKHVFDGSLLFKWPGKGTRETRYYKDLCDNCIRFAPLYINTQQYAGIHGINENIFQGALPMGVDFYNEIIKRS